MKQKNLVLMVVAVGCGLVAAFLTSMMAGGQKKEEMVEILVAAKELKPGDKFTKDSLKDQVKKKALPRTALPQNAADKEEDLIDKQLVKGLREGDHISVADTGVWEPLKPPSGHDLITIRLSIEQMTPFVKSTSHVDLFGTCQNRRTNEVKGAVLIPDLLVMAIDADPNPPAGAREGAMNKQVVTLAATQDECELIRVAQRASVELSFILLNPENISPAKKKAWSLEATRKWINEASGGKSDAQTAGAEMPSAVNQRPPEAPPATAPEPKKLTKYLVPKENLNPGTALTADVITDKFTEKEAEKLPDGALTDLKPYLGKYVTAQMWKGEPVTKEAIGDDPNPKPKVAESPKPAPKPEGRKYTEFDRTIYNGSVVKQYRYRQYDGETTQILMGELVDGNLVPVTGAPNQPSDKKGGDKKDEKSDDKRVSQN